MKMTDEQLTELLKSLEMEEPSMSFTRNVMEQVSLEVHPVSLKTKVNNKIIYGLAAIFVFAILGMFVYAAANATAGYSFPDLTFNFKIDKVISSTFLKVFLGVDLIIGLLYFDRLIRRKHA